MASLKIRVDENEAENVSKPKKGGAIEITKRAALGDLQNRGVIRNVTGKDAGQKDVKEVKTEKPRVDTQWRNVGTLTANQKLSENNLLGTKRAISAAARKIVTRSNSVRLVGTSKNNPSHVIQRNTSDIQHGQIKIKTLATKVVENSVQHAKNITKTKIEEEKTSIVQPAIEPTLRREDSNLSRKSLSKLKAALSRDVSSTKSTDLLNKATSTAATAKTAAKVKTEVAATAKVKSDGASTAKVKSKSEDAAVSKVKLEGAVNEKTAVLSVNSSENIAIKKELNSFENVAIKKERVRSDPVTIKPFNKFDLKIVSVQTHSAELLKGVEDIDADDADNLVLVSEYANDIYNYLYSLEVIHSIRPNHLDEQKEIYPKMRAVLIDWINEVHLQFHLVAETFQIAVAIIDRYLQMVKNTQRSQLQLVGVTALFIAAKFEELYPPALEDFVYITDDTYSAKQIIQMEIKIIKQLDFNLSRPVPLHFLRRYSKAANAEDSHHAMSKYFVELALIEYGLAKYKPSEIAAASIFLSLHLLNGNSSCDTGFNNSHWTKTLEWYSRYSSEHLRPIAKQIAIIAHNAPNAKLKAVYQKYQSSSFLKISLRPELSSELMKSISNSKEE